METTDLLVVVDVQNDFCPGGALAVPDGDAADVFELAADVLATPEGAESLGEARFYLRGCLGTLLRRGVGESRSTALDYLRQLARTAGTSGARRQFLDVHAAHADPQVHRQFLIELGL